MYRMVRDRCYFLPDAFVGTFTGAGAFPGFAEPGLSGFPCLSCLSYLGGLVPLKDFSHSVSQASLVLFPLLSFPEA